MGTAHVWQLAVLQGIAGAAAGFFNPASKALIPQTVSDGRLQQANALISLSRSTTNVFGPALAGAIVAVAGAGWVFAIDAGSFLFSVIFVAAMRVTPYAKPAAQRFWRDLAEGWQEVRRHNWLTAGFLGYAVGNFGVGLYIVVGSLVAIDRLGGAPAWGLIVGSAALGGVVGGFVAYRIRPSHPGGHGLCDLDALRAAAVRAGPAVPAPGRDGHRTGLRRLDPRRQHALRHRDAAGGGARPARAGRVDRPAALALPHAGRARCSPGRSRTRSAWTRRSSSPGR